MISGKKGSIPPHDFEAEKRILGAMIKFDGAASKAIEILHTEEPFYWPKHRLIFKAIVEIFDKSGPIDLPMVANQLKPSKQLTRIGGSAYIADLHDNVISDRNLERDAKTVLQDFVRREISNLFRELHHNSFESNADIQKMIDRTEARLYQLRHSHKPSGFLPINRLVNNVLLRVDESHRTGGQLPGHLRTGFFAVDRLIDSLKPSELIILAARPSMGKTSLAMNIAENVALCGEKSKGVGIFSMEMSANQLFGRLICGRSRVNMHKIRQGSTTPDDWRYLMREIKEVMNADIFIDDSSSLTLYEFRSKARHLKAQHNIGLLIVDYIQLMSGPPDAENKQQEMAGISRGLKSIAKELDLPIIAISQLSRQVEMRVNKRPVLSDLRDSGAIEQDADLVIFVYRPDFYLTDRERLFASDTSSAKEIQRLARNAEIIIAKQRNGPTGMANLEFIREYTRFQNADHVGAA